MGCSVRLALVLSFLVLAPPLVAQPAPRRPQGIYAGVNVEENIKKEQAANASVTPAELKAYFIDLYQDLLGNPAVCGACAVGELEHAQSQPSRHRRCLRLDLFG